MNVALTSMQGQGLGVKERPSKAHVNNIWEAKVQGQMGGNRFIHVKICNEVLSRNIFAWTQPRQFGEKHNDFLI